MPICPTSSPLVLPRALKWKSTSTRSPSSSRYSSASTRHSSQVLSQSRKASAIPANPVEPPGAGPSASTYSISGCAHSAEVKSPRPRPRRSSKRGRGSPTPRTRYASRKPSPVPGPRSASARSASAIPSTPLQLIKRTRSTFADPTRQVSPPSVQHERRSRSPSRAKTPQAKEEGATRASHASEPMTPACDGFAAAEGERRDSNPRPPGPQPGALPAELRPPRCRPRRATFGI